MSEFAIDTCCIVGLKPKQSLHAAPSMHAVQGQANIDVLVWSDQYRNVHKYVLRKMQQLATGLVSQAQMSQQ